jgi:hypothetical protein
VPNALFMVFLPILMVAVFSFVSVAVWSDARRKEREAFYRSETLKKIAESSGDGATAAAGIMREQERVESRRLREGLKLGGVVTLAAGAGLMIFLRGTNYGEQLYLVGLIPLLVGIALLVYSLILAPKD